MDRNEFKSHIENEIYNFIDYFSSDDKERIDMKEVADRYMEEVFELDEDEWTIREMENKVTSENWEYLHECFTDEERKKYDKIVYGENDEKI